MGLGSDALLQPANGMLFVNSGYGALGGMAGNVLLAFAVDEDSPKPKHN